MHTETPFDRLLWLTVLTVVVALVVVDFARGPLAGRDGSVSGLATPLTVWVADAGAADKAQELANQAAACWQAGGAPVTVGVLPGGPAQVVSQFLRHARRSPKELLLITGTTLAEIARAARQPSGTAQGESGRRAARLLARANPLSALAEDTEALVVRPDSPVRSAPELLAAMRARPWRPLLGVAEGAWLQGSLAALAQSAGARGAMPFSVFRSSREALVSLYSGQQEVALTPYSTVAHDVRRGALRQIAWPAGAPSDPIVLIAPSGLKQEDLTALRGQIQRLCSGPAWGRVLREDGLSPAPRESSAKSMRALLTASMREADRLQALASRIVRADS